MPLLKRSDRLKKELGLFDVYAISTGAMFSSGFFLLPGLAAAKAGPSVILAYLIAGLLILPAMVSQAELSTAMPRAGGTYYFLDRSLGPLVGTIGGMGTYFALLLKSAFALVGMGAYLAFFVELPIKPLAVACTVAFLVVNVVGAKETTAVQRVLVIILLAVLAFFVVQGLFEVAGIGLERISDTHLTPFMPFGLQGVFATAGFVFVSYAGLTKVASVAEEVRDPDRNLPLGMALSLLTATVIYVVGVFIMVCVLDPEALRSDLTPVATAGNAFFDWLPAPVGLILIVAAAVAAFASTGNAGLMSASRYPLAMSRDRLLPDLFTRLGRFHTPTPAILVSAALMITFIVALDVEAIAKLASAFQLFIFMLLNLAVIVMRESRIVAYMPGYKSPFYPWTQIIGLVAPILLIAFMGWLAIVFTIGIVIGCLIWYNYYARTRVNRDGAIYHWFERLGKRRYEGIDTELRSILKEKDPRSEDPFEELVVRAAFLDVEAGTSFKEIVERVAPVLAERMGRPTREIADEFLEGTGLGATPVAGGIALPHVLCDHLQQPELVLVRSAAGVCVGGRVPEAEGEDESMEQTAYALFFLASPKHDPGLHLRILARIAGRADEEHFMGEWLAADGEEQVKQVVLQDKRYLKLRIKRGGPFEELIGRPLSEAQFPKNCLVAVIHRNGDSIFPGGSTMIEEEDVLTVIGTTEGVAELRRTYHRGRSTDGKFT